MPVPKKYKKHSRLPAFPAYKTNNVVHLQLNFLPAMHTEHKPVIGLSCGDVNGIGLELIIKTVSDSRLLEICTPVIFANNKVLNFYRKAIPSLNLSDFEN